MSSVHIQAWPSEQEGISKDLTASESTTAPWTGTQEWLTDSLLRVAFVIISLVIDVHLREEPDEEEDEDEKDDNETRDLCRDSYSEM
jgi:hypothetical protein